MIQTRTRLYPAFVIFLSASVLVGFPTTVAAQIWGQHGVVVQPGSTPLLIGGANQPISKSGYTAYIDEVLNETPASEELRPNLWASLKGNGHGRTPPNPPGGPKGPHGGKQPPPPPPPPPEGTEDPGSVTPQVMVTPEPSTIVLLISGLAGLAFLARRRKRHSP